MKKFIFHIVFSMFLMGTIFYACGNQNQTYSTKGEPAQNAEQTNRTYAALVQNLLAAIRNNISTKSIEDKLANADAVQLHNELGSYKKLGGGRIIQ